MSHGGKDDTIPEQDKEDARDSDEKGKFSSSSESDLKKEEALEESLRDSEEELRKVTLTISKSWAESKNPPCGSGRGEGSSGSCSSDSSHRSSGLLDQLMAEMDQVFHDVLAEAEDDLKSFRHGIHATSNGSSPEQTSNFSFDASQQTSCCGGNRTCEPPLAQEEVEFLEENVIQSSKCVQTKSTSSSLSDDIKDGKPKGNRAIKIKRKRSRLKSNSEEAVSGVGCIEMSAIEVSSKDDEIPDDDVFQDGDKNKSHVLDRIFQHQGSVDVVVDDEGCCDMTEFAEKYFNLTIHSNSYTNAISKTVNMVRIHGSRKSFSDALPVDELLHFSKNANLPAPLLQLTDPENSSLACSIYKDFHRYMRSEMKADTSESFLRSVIGYCLERIELRDEVYCQLVRLTSGNPNSQNELRLWGIFALCSVSFPPSRTYHKYLRQHLKTQLEREDSSSVVEYVQYCLDHLQKCRRAARTFPPTKDEIEAVIQLEPIVCKFYFLDGTSRSITIDPLTTGQEAMEKLQEKIGLQSTVGWALYETTPDHEHYMLPDEYLSDVLSNWERKQKALASHSSTPKRNSPRVPLINYGKIVMCKRLCQRVVDIPHDPVELQLLYTQAVHYVVHLDEYSCPISAALHLAGLQCQVQMGDFDENKLQRYDDLDTYLCQRVLVSDSLDWAHYLASAHKKYGHGKSPTEAMLKYLTIVSQSPVYGCTKIFAHYRGIWPYGMETVLAINYEGVKFISLQEKTIAFDFVYSEIEQIVLEERNEECHIIIQLKNDVSQSRQKCYMFECLDLADFGKAIEFYCPRLVAWNSSRGLSAQFKRPSDWLLLYDEILSTRKLLLEGNIVRCQSQENLGLFRSALNKLSHRNSSNTVLNEQEMSEMSQASQWCFTKSPFKTSLTVMNSHEMIDVSARMFNSTLVYAGLESADTHSSCLLLGTTLASTAVLDDLDLVIVMQTLISKCMENKDLCDEFYLQLIKQTTDTCIGCSKASPASVDGYQKAVFRYWNLMIMACCVMLPPNPLVHLYLCLHLCRYASQKWTEESKYAKFCIKSLYRTYEKGGRKHSPSYREIGFVTSRQPIEARVFAPDGQPMLIEFDSAATVDEVIQIVKAKAGMRLDAVGFGLFEIVNGKEHYLMPDEKLADRLFSWERPTKSGHGNAASKDYAVYFKKRIFVDHYANYRDPVEVDMLYHQSVTDVFEQKILLTRKDAIKLCALRAQTEHGDFDSDDDIDYTSVIRILPRHLRDLIDYNEIRQVHTTLNGLNSVSANIAFLSILRHWPLYGATMFDVTQTSIESLPKNLWLTVSQIGVHIMERRRLQNLFYTYTFDEITECSPSLKTLSITVTAKGENPQFSFITSEANQIASLIKDYREILAQRRMSTHASSSDTSSDGQEMDSQKPSPKSSNIQRRRRQKLSNGSSPKVSPKRSPRDCSTEMLCASGSSQSDKFIKEIRSSPKIKPTSLHKDKKTHPMHIMRNLLRNTSPEDESDDFMNYTVGPCKLNVFALDKA